MKKHLFTIFASAAAITFPADAQTTQPTKVTEVVPARPTAMSITPTPNSVTTSVVSGKSRLVTEVVPLSTSATVPSVVTTTTESGQVITGQEVELRRLDPVVARTHLSVIPQTVIVTPEQRMALDRAVTVESQVQPARRVYSVERNVVIVEEQGQSRELPFVTLPVLFVVDSAELLDAESRTALEQTATVIKDIVQANPGAVFDVEGHTSTEGTAEHNMSLSVERSKRIFDELTLGYGVPVSALTAHGYGQNFAMYPKGTDRERQEDRRVLVVRTR